MKNATFYLLDNDTTVDGLSAVEQLVCEIAAERWRSGKRVLIACEDEKQAYRLDEALWARPAESFVPHNLAGEGPRGGAPVEIAWPQKRSSSPRDILIISGFFYIATIRASTARNKKNYYKQHHCQKSFRSHLSHYL